MDPAAGVKEVAKELKEKFDECGMGKVDEFIDKLGDIQKAEKIPTQIMQELQGLFGKFMDEVQKVIDDPGSLAPPSVAACGAWYGGEVVKKLKAMADETGKSLETVKKLATDIAAPMKQMGETLTNALSQMEGSVKKLAKLPAELQKMAADLSKPDDIAKIDTAPMKKSLDVSGINSPLDSIVGLKGVLEGAISMATQVILKIVEFMTGLPKTIKAAFEVPFPFCCMTGAIMSQAPAPMTSMLNAASTLEKFDMGKIEDVLNKTKDAVCGIDLEAVKKPIESFASAAGGPIDKLDKTVAGAKMASNPAGAMGGMGGFGS